MATLYFLKFNNYYNRQVKGLNFTFDDYIEYWAHTPDEQNYYGLAECDFYPADGVDTQHVVNTPSAGDSFATNFDYLLVVGLGQTIESRWFVVNSTRTCDGQYVVSLHRDLIVDYFEEVKNAPTYIERAMLPIENNLIFNSENMSFNQIKKREVLLKDALETPWIVGYLAPNVFTGISPDENPRPIELRATTERSAESYPTFSLERIQQLSEMAEFSGPAVSGLGGARISGNRGQGAATGVFHFNCLTGSVGEDLKDTSHLYQVSLDLTTTTLKAYENLRKRITEANKAEFQTLIKNKSTYGQTVGDTELAEIRKLSGQTVRDPASGKLFTFNLNFENGGDIAYVAKGEGWDGFSLFKSIVEDTDGYSFFEDRADKSFEIWNTHEYYSISGFQILPSGVSVTGSVAYTVNKPNDAPYYIFAMPYYPLNIRYDIESGTYEGSTKPQITQQIISDLSRKLVDGQYLYDLQLLPYAPTQILSYMSEYFDKTIDLTQDWFNEPNSITKFWYTDEITSQKRIGTVMFWLKSSSFRNTIAVNESLPTDPTEFKVANECDVYRLVSPNYAGAFEFSATKNGGIQGFEVNCTYKPFQPYIHINPIWGRLYGGDFNDNRGLVLGGDFSLPQTVDQWANYQIQNKSYMESFNRQVENMETNFSIEREQQRTAAIINTITGGITGFGAGMMAGGGGYAGAITGGVMGAVSVGANLYGMTKDLEYADRLHKEATSFAQDQFNYSLRNIQALPQTLSRTSAFDINSKFFPFLEFYTATDEEKQALREKIKYNSMTVMTINTINNFIISDNPSFISAQLIRAENLGEDYHLATAIAAELHKGIYI